MKRLLIALALIFCAAVPATAQIRIMEASAGFDGYIRSERWVPVEIKVAGAGAPFIGSLEIGRGETIFHKSIEISSGVKNLQMLTYQPQYYEPLFYRIKSQSGTKLMQFPIDTRLLNQSDNLIVVVSDGDYNHQFINGEQNPWGGKTFVVYRKPQDLFDDWLAYSVADGIAIGNVALKTLSARQWKALLQYAASGGVLIMSPETGTDVLNDPLLARSLPVRGTGYSLTTNAEFLIPKWTSKKTEPFPEVDVPVQQVTAHPHQLQLVTGKTTEQSLITTSPFYKGSIIYFAFDYTRMPESTRSEFGSFWNEIVYPSNPNPPYFGFHFRQKLEDNPRVQKDLYEIPGLKIPDVKWFALFFFVYIVAIGPLQFALLRMLKKNSMLWITFPAIVLLFALSAWGYSRIRQTSGDHLTQVSVVEYFPGLGQQVDYTTYGITIQDSGTFDFRSEFPHAYLKKNILDTMMYRPEPYTMLEDLPRTLANETLKSRTFRTIESISTTNSEPPVSVRYSVVGNKLTGQARNSMRVTLQDAFFVYDQKNVMNFGSLNAGETRNFQLELNDLTSIPITNSHVREMLDLYSPSYSTPRFLFGRISGEKGMLFIDGKERKTARTSFIAVYSDAASGKPSQDWRASQAQQMYYGRP